MTTVAILLMWVKGLLWLRLFSTTSFYIRLISETMKDITYFMIILLIFLIMFANCLYILDLYRAKEAPDLLLVETYFEGWDTINTLFNQYLLALGEFGMDNFKEGSPNLVIVISLFIVATFLTQITILNMLIAIMGDTFGKVTEIKEQAGLKEKINILADFVWLIPNEKVEFRYVY